MELVHDPLRIASLIKDKLAKYKAEIKTEEIGVVFETGDGIARIFGLPNAMVGELLEFSEGVYGMVFNLEKEEILAVMLAGHTKVKEGDWAKSTGHIISVPVGDELLGRVINAQGEPLDGLGDFKAKKYRFVEQPAPAVIDRVPVCRPLQTGYKLVDALIPIGRGQRELIIGDRQTGKTTLAVDAIINQKDQNVFCIYVAIGQKSSQVVEVVQTLKEHGAMDYTVVVNAPASDPASLQYLAPFAGTTIAEEFRNRGKDVLIIYDDLSKHAAAYRQISLLLRRPPGREAYPGDIFYLHSRLLERAAKLNDQKGGGSLTALPIIETQNDDISTYIPTNLISITDGQIFLKTDLFNAGIRPAVDVGISVSRVGSKAQAIAMKDISNCLKLDLAQFRELESFTLFATDLDRETKTRLDRGYLIVEVLKQDKNKPLPLAEEVAMIFTAVNGHLDGLPLDQVAYFESEFLKHLRKKHPQLLATIQNEEIISPATVEDLTEATENFKASLIEKRGLLKQ